MTMTIAARWRVTFRVQSLARVTMPSKAAMPLSRKPDAATIMQQRQVRADLMADRGRWEEEAYLCGSRRMF